MSNKAIILEAYKDSISITHRHILSVINTMINYEMELRKLKTIRILDAGCGDGKLIHFLHQYLPQFNSDKRFELFGYDVGDHGVQQTDYIKKTFAYLYEKNPDIDWSERIRLIKSTESWPFEEKSFDIVVSNQVLEHVWDHNHFFKENSRVLSSKGFSIHLFPVKDVLIDWHVFLPKVHQLKSWDAIYKKVRFYSRLGFGLYKKEKHLYNNNIDSFSRAWADKIYHYCNYLYYSELAASIKKNGLCLTTRYTYDFYVRKLKETLGLKSGFLYKNSVSSKISFYFLKHISGVSIILYKGEYSKYE